MADKDNNPSGAPLAVIDARLVNEAPSGIGVYATEMLARIPRLAPDLRFLALFRSAAIRTAAMRGNASANLTAAILPYGPFSPQSQLLLPFFLRRAGAALYHTPNFIMPYLAFPRSLGGRCRCIANIHDLIPLVVANYAPNSRTSKFRGVYRACVRETVRRSHAIVTGSQAAKADIVRVFGLDAMAAARCHVVFDGADLPAAAGHTPVKRVDDFASPRLLVYVGRMDPYKNIPLLVDAFARIRAACPFPVRLKVIGPKDPRYPEAERRAAELGVADDIVFTGFVTDAELAEAYRTADLLTHPSRYEGFGLPLVEAMAAGTPVLCTAGGSQPEVVGDAAAVVPADDSAAFADAAVAILCSPARQEELRRLGRARAGRFSWDETAHATLALYRAILGTGGMP